MKLKHILGLILLLSTVALADDSQDNRTKTFDINDTYTIRDGGGNYTLLVGPDEQSTLVLHNTCSGTQSRGIDVGLQRNGSRHFYDLTASHLSVIYGYFQRSLECSRFISTLLSASQSHPLKLTITENDDYSQSIEVDGLKFQVRREWYLSPF